MSDAMTIMGMLVPKPSDITKIATEFEHQREKARMDLLSDPEFKGRYSITATRRAVFVKPAFIEAPSLREALDWFLNNESKWKKGHDGNNKPV